MNKLALGTAQFGLDYGINNQRGKVPPAEVFEIIDRAAAGGIDLLDTASAYGESEQVLGEYLEDRGRQLKIVSKLSAANAEQAAGLVAASLAKLGREKLYGYLLHDFAQYSERPEIWQALVSAKAAGRIAKIGFSLYYPEDLERLFDSGVGFDLVQVPYSVFDQRFGRQFDRLKEKNIEVHVRSVFLQGLVFKTPSELSGALAAVKGKLAALRALAERTGVPVAGLCLNFAAGNPNIDKVVVGVDSAANLREVLMAVNGPALDAAVIRELSALKEDNEQIILPFNWGARK